LTLNLGTNGGPLVSNQVCDIRDLGMAWFNKDSITNIISLAHMTSKYKATYDSERDRVSIFGEQAKKICAIQTIAKWVVCNEPTKQ